MTILARPALPVLAAPSRATGSGNCASVERPLGAMAGTWPPQVMAAYTSVAPAVLPATRHFRMIERPTWASTMANIFLEAGK